LSTTQANDLVLAPDGSMLVLAPAFGQGLFGRKLNGLAFERIAGAERGGAPFFSPDSKWIGFRSGDRIMKVPADGGPAIAICDAARVNRATWGDDGTIVMEMSGDLFEVPETGGTPHLLLKADADGTFTQPYFLAGSQALLVRRGFGGPSGRIEAINRRTLARVRLAEGSHPMVAVNGALVFEQQGHLWAVRFDQKRLTVRGVPVPIVDSVRVSFNQALFSTSSDGSLAYVRGGATTAARSLVWVDRTGKTIRAVEATGEFQSPRVSPDGKRVVVSVSEGSSLDLWSYDLERGTRLRLTTSGNNRRTVWSSDGTQIAYYSNRAGTVAPLPPEGSADQDLYVIPSTGGEPKLLLARPGPQYPDAWSADGRFIVFEDGESGNGARRDLWVLPLGGSPSPLVVTPFNEHGAVLSPDDEWFAFVSDESGRSEVYVQPFQRPGAKIPISTNGGLQPVWARSGRELFYREGDWLMRVAIQTSPLAVSVPGRLFELPVSTYNLDQNFADYDVAPDGRFIAIRADTSDRNDDIVIVLNWVEELNRRVPSK
jgi:hypothetical protein